MAEAQHWKCNQQERDSLMLLMSTPEDQITTVEGRKFMQLLRAEELAKLKKRLAEDAKKALSAEKAEAEQFAALAKVLLEEQERNISSHAGVQASILIVAFVAIR